MKILIIDDEPDLTIILKLIINHLSNNHEVITSNSPVEAQSLILNNRFDVIMVDMIMPGINGIDLISSVVWLKQGPNRVFIVPMTGGGDGYGMAERLMKAGVAKRVLYKPYAVDDIKAILEEAQNDNINYQNQERENREQNQESPHGHCTQQ